MSIDSIYSVSERSHYPHDTGVNWWKNTAIGKNSVDGRTFQTASDYLRYLGKERKLPIKDAIKEMPREYREWFDKGYDQYQKRTLPEAPRIEGLFDKFQRVRGGGYNPAREAGKTLTDSLYVANEQGAVAANIDRIRFLKEQQKHLLRRNGKISQWWNKTALNPFKMGKLNWYIDRPGLFFNTDYDQGLKQVSKRLANYGIPTLTGFGSGVGAHKILSRGEEKGSGLIYRLAQKSGQHWGKVKMGLTTASTGLGFFIPKALGLGFRRL